MNGFEVKEIKAEETYRVRHSELRKGRPLEECKFAGDERETTIHIGGFYQNQLVAVATFLKQDHADCGFQNAYQLRGMAVVKEHHKKGFGKILLTFAEALLLQKVIPCIWMNARIGAVDFYKKLGYGTIGNVFEIPKIGMHYVMFKKLY
ncbi:GNAT family N-acetyltransferase [Ulvibacterium sp.]|uniref:GNAT family N-acetyltransferase n=1 Tax=Ulvibacterium sp. TaxID=2665914 RepID=UPI003BAB3174